MKFPTKNGIGEVSCDQRETSRCYNLSLRKCEQEEQLKRKETEEGEERDVKKFKTERIEPVEDSKRSQVQYTDWLANVVVVPKASKKWRMCTDFTDLDKVCPKDPYPLPRIDLLVYSTAGYELFSMMDAYQGTMYQRLVNKMFKDQVGKTMEVYVDDMLVKSRKEQDHLKDLKQAFEVMRIYGMKLNSSKCTFGVRRGKFLGYMVSKRGIEANPEKIEAIARFQSPKMLKDVQKLTGMIAYQRVVAEVFPSRSQGRH
ncbi:UNVERIFIED_CONTAM: Retrovirus-related Pol polyprotein from transposon gypsy [Sesamum radiatum]|uniref:Retrovirus-related Pol polyprotein from transposon gypsy n=1 Tax=Sesamum radiatum TaxID=300843 RepID=A0AAW2KBB1_SESRA